MECYQNKKSAIFVLLLLEIFSNVGLSKSLKCFACHFTYTNSLSAPSADDDEWCANDTLVTMDSDLVIRPCAAWEKFCSTTIVTMLKSFTSITRQCVESCSKGCEASGYGQDHVSCTECCDQDKCNNNHALDYYLEVMAQQFTSWTKPDEMPLLLPPRVLLMPYLSLLMAFWLLVLSCCHHHHHHHHYFFHHHHNNGNNNNNNCPGPNCHRHSNTCANNGQTPPADWAQMPLVEQQKCAGGQLQQLPMPPTMMLINGQQQPAQPVVINSPNRQYDLQQQQQLRWLEQQQQFNTRVVAQQQQQLPKQQMKSGIASATNGPLFRTTTSLSPVGHPTLLPRKPSNNRPGTMHPIKYLKGANSLWLTSTTKKEATKLIAATQPPPPTLSKTTTITNSSRMSVLPAATQPPQQVQAVQAEQSDQQQEAMDDLPPPPPSRFLPEWEKVRIAELQKKQRQLKNGQNLKGSGDFARRSTTETTTRKVVNQLDTNEIFLRCCRAKRVPQSCESRCNFDALNKKTLTGMFLGRDKCPSEHGIDLLSCAAQDSDHTKCCKEKQVQRTRAGDKCFTFCDLNPETMKVTADASYMPCLTVLKEIKTCFQEKILSVLQNKLPT
ncbi:hypothetical protein GPALN_003061 [Globodera pallida]|nr:hypothetical protein GPALN_003061 [Globodera pallida]